MNSINIIFVLVGWLAIVSYADEIPAGIKLVQMCKEKEGASDTELGEYVSDKKPMSRMSSCLGACFLENLGIMKDGQFNYEGAVELSRKDPDPKEMQRGIELANVCRSVRGTDRCDAVVKLVECIKKNGSDKGIMEFKK